MQFKILSLNCKYLIFLLVTKTVATNVHIGFCCKKVMWFTGNSKKYYCVAKCPFHGFVRGKIQMKKYGADPHLVFPIKIVKPISEEDVEKICEMKRQVTEKRRLKRIKQGS